MPIFWPLAIGATSDFGRSIVAFRRSYLPRAVVTSSGCATPTRTTSSSPFHTFGEASALPASYRRWVSWKRKPQLSSACESTARWFSLVSPITTVIRRWSPRWAEAIRQ